MRLVWAKLRASGWKRSAVYQYVWKLFVGISHTKTSQEDILQELTHAQRQNRRRDIHMPRVAYAISTSRRLQSLPLPALELATNDIRLHGKKAKPIGDDFVPKSLKSTQATETDSVSAEAVRGIRAGKDKAHVEKVL